MGDPSLMWFEKKYKTEHNAIKKHICSLSARFGGNLCTHIYFYTCFCEIFLVFSGEVACVMVWLMWGITESRVF